MEREARHTEPAQEVTGALPRPGTPIGPPSPDELSFGPEALPLRLALGRLVSLIM